MVPEALLHSGYRRKTDGSRTEFGEAVIQELDLGDDEGLAVDAGRQSDRPRANPAADQEEVVGWLRERGSEVRSCWGGGGGGGGGTLDEKNVPGGNVGDGGGGAVKYVGYM